VHQTTTQEVIMAVSPRLKACLKDAGVSFTAATHPVVYTAQEIAAAQHVSGRQLAKSVLITTDRGPTLVVLPATQLVDLKKLKRILNAKRLGIGRESDIRSLFPDIEVGAMSPFGNLYGVPVVVDESLADVGEIVFNAGSHTDTIRMRYQDFERLVKPKAAVFGLSPATPRKAPKRAKKKAPARSRARPRATPKKRTPAKRRSSAKGATRRPKAKRSTR